MKINYKYNLIFLIVISFFLTPGFFCKKVYGALQEQLTIDVRAMSLAGSVTGSPTGVMAIHYNPAGLSLFKDGTFINIGVLGGRTDLESRFIPSVGYNGVTGFGNDPVSGQKSKVRGVYGYAPLQGVSEASENFNGAEITPASGGIVHRQTGSRLTSAWGVYSPLAGGYYYPEDDPAVYSGEAGYFHHFIYSAPAFSYRLSETFSAGISAGLGYTALGRKLSIRPPRNLVALTGQTGGSTIGISIPLTPDGSMPVPWYGGGLSPYESACDIEFTMMDNFSPSFNVGVLWQPIDFFALGLTYQSPVNSVLQGDYRLEYSSQWQAMIDWFGEAGGALSGIPSQSVARQTGTLLSEVDIPQMAHIGIKLKPFKGLSFMVDLHWTNWSAIDETRYEFDQDIQLLQMYGFSGYSQDSRTLVFKRDMKDTLNWSAGFELNLNKNLLFRFGYEDRKTSVNDDYFDISIPVTDLDVFGTGLGILFDNGITLDIGFSFMDGEKFQVPDNTSRLMNNNSVAIPVYNPYAGLDFETELDVYIAGFSITIPFDLTPSARRTKMESVDQEAVFKERMVQMDREIKQLNDLDEEIKKQFEKVIEKESEIEIKKRFEKVEKRESEEDIRKIFEKLEERESEVRIVKIYGKIEEKESEEEIRKRFEEAVRKQVEEEVKKRFEEIVEKKLDEARVNKALEEEKRKVSITPFQDVETR